MPSAAATARPRRRTGFASSAKASSCEATRHLTVRTGRCATVSRSAALPAPFTWASRWRAKWTEHSLRQSSTVSTWACRAPHPIRRHPRCHRTCGQLPFRAPASQSRGTARPIPAARAWQVIVSSVTAARRRSCRSQEPPTPTRISRPAPRTVMPFAHSTAPTTSRQLRAQRAQRRRPLHRRRCPDSIRVQ